jgi:hypothetical protein
MTLVRLNEKDGQSNFKVIKSLVLLNTKLVHALVSKNGHFTSLRIFKIIRKLNIKNISEQWLNQELILANLILRT